MVPTLLFDEHYYAGQLIAYQLPPLDPEQAAFVHWVKYGAIHRIVPTVWFDEAFYLQSNPDVARAGLFGFVHFIRFGIYEFRRPNRWFDPDWYQMQTATWYPELPAFTRFLQYGANIGVSPSRSLRLLTWEGLAQNVLLDHCRLVGETIKSLVERFDLAEIERLVGVFLPDVYRQQASLPDTLSAQQVLCHYLTNGLECGLPCSKLFDANFYVSALRSYNLPPVGRDESAIMHWVRYGEAAGVIPVSWFDGTQYLSSNPDIIRSGVLPFTHYLDHGIFEQRTPAAWFDPAHYECVRGGKWSELPSILHFLMHGSAAGLGPNAMLQGLALAETDIVALNIFYPRLRDQLSEIESNLPSGMMRHFLALFEPAYYIRQAGLPRATSVIEALLHFLDAGMSLGTNPSPLFDGAFYAEAAAQANLPAIWQTPLLIHFLKYGLWQRVVPSPLFDLAFYLQHNVDLDPEHVFAYEHFFMHGIKEGRRPTIWFDQGFCASRLDGDPTVPTYIRALMTGLDEGVVPCAALASLLGTVKAPGRISLQRYRQLMVATLAWSGAQLDAALLLFLPEGYDGGGELSPDADTIDRLIHFLQIGLARGDDIGPLLQPAVYLSNLAHARLPQPQGPLALHFAQVGQSARVLPTTLFDEATYLALYNDIAEGSLWSFIHFLQHGLYEGRSCNQRIALQIDTPSGPAGGPFARRRLLIAAGIVPADTRPDDLGYITWMLECQTLLREALSSPETAALVSDMSAFDPSIGDLANITNILAPPFHDPIAAPHRAIIARLAQLHYDTVVCVPWIRNGGADLVAGSFTFALRRTRPGERVLLLRTDNPHFDRPDWIAPDVDVLDLSDILSAVGDAMAERLLHTLFLGLAPTRVVNINSRLCWRTYRRFGRRLSDRIQLYSYLFCWDQTRSGVRTGYPSEFYPETAAFLAGVFTDTQYLKDELVQMYVLPLTLRMRLSPLFSPARMQPAHPTMAERGAACAGTRARPRVLWGGRLDYQKRFDILEAVAWRMPQVDFLCWGEALLDSAPDPARLPPNITMQGSFKALTDLPLGDCDGWLFTSAWEGMPTTVIELATLGMPMVCSAVGGVPDLIDATTGWPVPPNASIEGYVKAVEEMISRPDLRIARASRVQAMALEVYTAANYDRSLAAVLDREISVQEMSA